MKKPDTEIADRKELIEYIEWASKVIDGSSKLQIELSMMCDILADDIKLAYSGHTSGFMFLSGNKDDKIFERLMTLVKNRSDLAALTLITTTDETTTKKKITKMQDIVLNGK